MFNYTRSDYPGHLAYKGRTGGVGLDQADLERPTPGRDWQQPEGRTSGTLAARIAGVKTRIYWIRGAKWDGRDDALGTVLRAMDRGTCRLSTARLAVSQSMVDAYMRQGIASDLTLLGRGGSRGVDAERFARSRSEKLHDPRDSLTLGAWLTARASVTSLSCWTR